MEYAIAIPTRNRPDSLRTLLDELIAQKREYGWDIPIYVFDQSSDARTSRLVKEFRSDVKYCGGNQRERLVSGLVSRAHLERRVVEATFNRGYGGNRNFILATLPQSTVICLDDDVTPASLKRRGSPITIEAPADEKKLISYKERIDTAQTRIERYNFVQAMQQFIGKPCGEVDAITASEVVDRSISNIGTLRLATPAACSPGRKIMLAAPFISFHDDVRVHLLADEEVVVYDYLSSVVAPKLPLGYTCYAADHTLVSSTPFAPTFFRCEDSIHLSMVEHLGYSAQIGVDVIHRRGRRLAQSVADLASSEMGSIVMSALCKRLWSSSQFDLTTFAGKMRKASGDLDLLTDLCETNADMLALMGYEYSPSPKDISRFTRAVSMELQFAAGTFETWGRIMEYVGTLTPRKAERHYF